MADYDYTVDDLVQRSLTLGILDMHQIQEVWSAFGTQNVDADAFLNMLIRQGKLTKYQMERLVSGETTGFYFGDYKVLYLVGAGSFARVYRAAHKTTKKVVAIKVLRARFRDNQTEIDHFMREAELGIELKHPNIVTAYEVQNNQDGIYIVMDFIEGRNLRDEVRIQKKVEPKRATRIATDICSALDYAFKRGHQHRDLKLTNVILASTGKAILLDFGLASSDQDDVKNQRSIDYAALERITGVHRDDKRSDVYFLGCIFYHMLSGIPPLFETKIRAKRLDRSRFLNVRPLQVADPSVPLSLAFIVDKAMKLDPEERYQSPGAMLADLETVVKKLDAGQSLDRVSAEKILTRSEMETNKTTIMIIESNPNMQDIFRDSFKKAGYRVLVISDPHRAIERFEDGGGKNVDLLLINAQSLGPKGVEAFNRFGDENLTKDIPAILLLDENQIRWAAKAKRNKHRLAVGMPITMKRLQLVLNKLLKEHQAAQKQAEEAKQAAAQPKTDNKLMVDSANLDAEKSAEITRQENAGSTAETAADFEEFQTELFDAAIDDAVEMMTQRINTHSKEESEAVPSTEKPGISEESEEDDSDDYDYDYEDDEKASS